ncbi:MAG: hypothetical protein WCI73_13700 [Phycisphaerae bacterium]
MRDLFFVSCTAGRQEETLLWRSLQKLGISAFHFFEHNQRGLPACYNTYLNQFAGTNRILVLVHDDVSINDVFVQEKLNDALLLFDIVGVVGSAQFDTAARPTTYTWSVWPKQYLSGAVEHEVGAGLNTWMTCGITPRRCVIMDGLFLAIDLLSIGRVRFDERFDFHLYDLDFCLQAHHAGRTLGTTNLFLHHASMGDYYTPAYEQAIQTFRAKWTPTNAGKITL